MVTLRSLVYTVAFYGWSTVVGLFCLPLLLGPRRWSAMVMRVWARGALWLLRAICGVKVEVRGVNPSGPALVAAKHHGILDTIAPLIFIPHSAYVMKRELFRIPVYGWFAQRGGMIGVDRTAHSKALRAMRNEARERLAENRQIVIFPEGTRVKAGRMGEYKPGVAALYRDLEIPCTPMATNSGAYCSAAGSRNRPGVVVYEFGAPIPPGLARAAFMRELESRIESATNALLHASPGFTTPEPLRRTRPLTRAQPWSGGS